MDYVRGEFSLFMSEMLSNMILYEIKILWSSRNNNRVSASVGGERAEDSVRLWIVSGEKKRRL
jgi:hypothetical protein